MVTSNPNEGHRYRVGWRQVLLATLIAQTAACSFLSNIKTPTALPNTTPLSLTSPTPTSLLKPDLTASPNTISTAEPPTSYELSVSDPDVITNISAAEVESLQKSGEIDLVPYFNLMGGLNALQKKMDSFLASGGDIAQFDVEHWLDVILLASTADIGSTFKIDALYPGWRKSIIDTVSGPTRNGRTGKNGREGINQCMGAVQMTNTVWVVQNLFNGRDDGRIVLAKVPTALEQLSPLEGTRSVANNISYRPPYDGPGTALEKIQRHRDLKQMTVGVSRLNPEDHTGHIFYFQELNDGRFLVLSTNGNKSKPGMTSIEIVDADYFSNLIGILYPFK